MKKHPKQPQLLDFVNRYSGKRLFHAKTLEQKRSIALSAVHELGPAADKFLRMLALALSGPFSVHVGPAYFELSFKLRDGTTLVGKGDSLYDAIQAAVSGSFQRYKP